MNEIGDRERKDKYGVTGRQEERKVIGRTDERRGKAVRN